MTEAFGLGELEPFDQERSLSLREARELIRGAGNGRVSHEVLRRWCNPAIGCRPQGASGPVLVLPALKLGGKLRTMPSWVEAFREARERLSVLASKKEVSRAALR